MKNYKVLLIITLGVMLALIGGLVAVQLLSPPYPVPSSSYTLRKAENAVQHYQLSSYEADENGKIPLELFSVTVEVSNYAKSGKNGYTSYFYAMDRYGKLECYTSDGKEVTLDGEKMSLEERASAIEGLREEFDTYKRILSNLKYDVPTEDGVIKVYLNCSYGPYLKEYSVQEFEKCSLYKSFEAFGME